MCHKCRPTLLSKSKSKQWDVALFEWKIDKNPVLGNLTKCICGHVIKYKNYCYNRSTKQCAILGSCCINSAFTFKKNKKIMDYVFNSVCDCGVVLRRSSMKGHLLSKSHIKIMKYINTCGVCKKTFKSNRVCYKCQYNRDNIKYDFL